QSLFFDSTVSQSLDVFSSRDWLPSSPLACDRDLPESRRGPALLRRKQGHLVGDVSGEPKCFTPTTPDFPAARLAVIGNFGVDAAPAFDHRGHRLLLVRLSLAAHAIR